MMFKSLSRVLLCFTAAAAFMVFGHGTALAGTATLNWLPPTTNTDGTPISALSGFKVYYGTASGSYSGSVTVGNVTSYTLSNLADGATYYFAVTAYNSNGMESAYSQEVSKKTLAPDTAGPVISGVYAMDIASDSATIYWSTDELADSQVEYGATTAYGYAMPLDATNTAAHSQTITGLAPSTLYNYRVISKDMSGNSTVSGNFTFTTGAPVDSAPPVISNIQISNITPSSATVAWTTDEPSTSRVSYNSAMTAENTELVTVHTVELTGLASYTTYDFSVKSADATGNTAMSATEVFTTSNVTPGISSFGASPLTGITPLPVNFTASAADTDGFIATYEWDFEGDGVYDMSTGSTPSASFTYNTVGTYNARVRITDNGGASVISDPLAVSVSSATNQPPIILQITGTVTQNGSTTTVKFDVTASDPNGVIVKFAWDFDGNGTIDAVTTSAPAQFTYSVPGTYTPTVTVTDDQGGVATTQSTVTVGASTSTDSTTQASTASSGDSSSGGGKCFIATAAYGSYLEPEVMVLRQFRDRYLMTNSAGARLVAVYYDLSPGVADYIATHQWARLSARTMLTPLVYGLKYPFMAGALMLFVAAAVLARFINRRF